MIPFGSLYDIPNVYINIADSPKIFPTYNAIELNISGSAVRSTIVNNTRKFLVPSANAASLYSLGTFLNASSEVLIIVGSMHIDIVKHPAIIEVFNPHFTQNIEYPKIPNIIEGIPDKMSKENDIVSLNILFFKYCVV